MKHVQTTFKWCGFAVFAMLASVFLISCLDSVQTVSYKDGAYHLYYKVTLSKVLFALGDEDPESIFDALNDDVFSDLPKHIKVNKVNTDLEVGAEFALTVKANSSNKTERSFLPTTVGNKCYIPFLLGTSADSYTDSLKSDEDYESLVEALLASAKCRVMVSKSVVPVVETAYFEGTGGQNCSVPVFDYGESWCMEIPFIVLFDTSMYRFDRLVVIKG